MTPPTDLAEWATAQTNNAPPTSGQKATGWTTGQKGVSSYDNWWKYAVHLWVLFLNSLFDSLANMLLPASLTVTGSVTVGGQLLAFTDFVYTADSTTDQLAKTAHGLETGDGPIRTSNSGGGLPTGLVAVTDYYAIKVDADHIKAATSRANAIAGTFIDITSNGTGTQTLLHQAGTTRVTDATVTRNLTVNGNATVGGTLGVTSGLTVGGTLSVTGLLTALFGLVLGTNKDVTLSGTGNVKHGTWTKTLGANADGNPAHSWVTIDGTTIGALNVHVDKFFQLGDVITAIRIHCTDNVTGGTRVTSTFQKRTTELRPRTRCRARFRRPAPSAPCRRLHSAD
jgi:hypothetical protein